VPRDFSRALRVGAELQRVINELLQLETKDPRLKEVRISEVEVSGDLGVAKVYFGLLRPEDDAGPAIKAFASASGFIRRRIGQEIRLRRVPELRFIHDASARQGLEISQLIDAAARPERNGES
jgi:ribosome-binding factor A